MHGSVISDSHYHMSTKYSNKSVTILKLDQYEMWQITLYHLSIQLYTFLHCWLIWETSQLSSVLSTMINYYIVQISIINIALFLCVYLLGMCCIIVHMHTCVLCIMCVVSWLCKFSIYSFAVKHHHQCQLWVLYFLINCFLEMSFILEPQEF